MNQDRLIQMSARAIGMICNEWGKTPEQAWNWLNSDTEFEISNWDLDDNTDYSDEYKVVGHRYDEHIEFIKSKL